LWHHQLRKADALDGPKYAGLLGAKTMAEIITGRTGQAVIDNDVIYFVTVFYLPKNERTVDTWRMNWNDKPEGWDSIWYKRSRCWGWYRDVDRARKIVLENRTDIYENGYYDLALIEPMGEGVCSYQGDSGEWYDVEYKADLDYVVTKIEKPLRLKQIVGFSYT
jgi:hypothetical protein